MLSLFGKPEVNVMEPLDDMSSTMYHIKQIARRREPEVDSEAGPVRRATLVLPYRSVQAPAKFHFCTTPE